jgi:Na+-driven multidrug efflux pump
MAVLYATILCVAGFLLAMFAPAYVIALFNPKSQRDPQLMAVGTHAIRICLAMYPIVGFQIVSSSYFLAVGKPKQALLLGLSRQVLLLIPAIILIPRFLGLNGVWIAIPTADLCASLLTGVWLFVELRHLRDRHVETAAGRVDEAIPGNAGSLSGAAQPSTNRGAENRCADSRLPPWEPPAR